MKKTKKNIIFRKYPPFLRNILSINMLCLLTISYEERLDKMEATEWHNYLTETEAAKIAPTIVNQDGTHGPHWSYDVFKGAVESLGGKPSEKPYYNCYALWVTANMIYSDHAQSVAEDMGFNSPSDVPNEKMALSMYKKAVEKLKDVDRPMFIRPYFRV